MISRKVVIRVLRKKIGVRKDGYERFSWVNKISFMCQRLLDHKCYKLRYASIIDDIQERENGEEGGGQERKTKKIGRGNMNREENLFKIFKN